MNNWSIRCYRQLMRVYPQEFRATFGESVDQAFRDLARDAYRSRGHLGLALLWFRVLPDLVFSAIELFSSKAGDYLKWSFRLRWVMACSAGFAAGAFLAKIALLLGLPPNLGGIPMWLSIGALQSLVLPIQYRDRTQWAIFSVLGGVIGHALTMSLFPLAVVTANAIAIPIWVFRVAAVPMAITGAVIGLFQWWTLRKGHLEASRWIVACSGGLVTFSLVFALSQSMVLPLIHVASRAMNTDRFDTSLFLFFGGIPSIIAGAAFGAITAVPLERILRPQSAMPQESKRMPISL
jgi:hypothetical protein